MSQSDQFDNLNNSQENFDAGSDNSASRENTVSLDSTVSSDTYHVESSADIYDSPDIIDVTPENGNSDEAFAAAPYGSGPYGSDSYTGGQYQNNRYGNEPYGNNQYGNNPYGNNPYGNNQYGNNQYGNNQYGNNQYSNNPYGNDPHTGNPYGNGWQGSNPYGGPSGIPPYGNGQYSPFAAPPKKNRSGLIIGIVVAVIVLFLIAVFALVYKAMDLYSQSMRNSQNSRDEYDFDDDDWGNSQHRDYDYDDDYDYDYDYDYDDGVYDYDYDYDYDDDWFDDYDYDDYGGNSPYYEIHNEIRDDLSYSVEFEDEDYDPRNDNVDIELAYPVISGGAVPNLDQINDAIHSEIAMYIDFYEEEYGEVIDDDYYQCRIVPYVTYMDEEKLSIILDERINSAYYSEVYLCSFNIDMEHGVVMDNENILGIDDDFSIDFRRRCEEQNGSISSIDMMSDQQITELFNSENIIVFYTPMGMEIGFNYDGGWVTVTYEDYEQYLKVF